MNKACFLVFILLIYKAEAQTSALKLADSLNSVGNYQKVIQLYQREKIVSAEIHQKIAQAYQATGNLGQAISNYKKAIQQDENLVIAKSNLGKLFYQIRNYKASDSLFSELSLQYPENPDFYYRVGLAKEKLKDSTYFNYFKKTLERDNTHQKAFYELAKYKYRQKNYHEVEFLGKKALISYENNTKMISLLARNAIALKNVELAKTRFEKLLDLNKKTVFVYQNLGYCYFNLQEYEKALSCFKSVITLKDTHQKAILNAGRILNIQEKYKEAEPYLRMAIVLAEKTLDHEYEALGVSLQKQNNFKEAIDYFSWALEENPTNFRAQYQLAVCADNYYGDLQTVINYYELFLDRFGNTPKASYYVVLAKQRLADLRATKHLEGK
jgi:tetratricopeptide (TPR) repeat protein